MKNSFIMMGAEGGKERKKPYREAQVVAIVGQMIDLGREWADKRIGKARKRWTAEEEAQLKRLIYLPSGTERSQAESLIVFLWETPQGGRPASLRLMDKRLTINGCNIFEIDATGSSIQVVPLKYLGASTPKGRREAFLTGDDRERVIDGLHRFFQLDGFQIGLQKQAEKNVWHFSRGPEEIEKIPFDWAADALHERRTRGATSFDRGRYQAAFERILSGIKLFWDRERVRGSFYQLA